MITYPHFCICLFINLNYLPLYLNTYSLLINFNVVQLNAGLTLFLFAFVGKINYIIIVFRARCNSSPAVRVRDSAEYFSTWPTDSAQFRNRR